MIIFEKERKIRNNLHVRCHHLSWQINYRSKVPSTYIKKIDKFFMCKLRPKVKGIAKRRICTSPLQVMPSIKGYQMKIICQKCSQPTPIIKYSSYLYDIKHQKYQFYKVTQYHHKRMTQKTMFEQFVFYLPHGVQFLI